MEIPDELSGRVHGLGAPTQAWDFPLLFTETQSAVQ
jgi:hypothetical protein